MQHTFSFLQKMQLTMLAGFAPLSTALMGVVVWKAPISGCSTVPKKVSPPSWTLQMIAETLRPPGTSTCAASNQQLLASGDATPPSEQ